MRYLFYPGCSQEGSAREYRDATLAVLRTLGAEVEELQDWSCCGATVAASASRLLGFVLPARNLALAEQQAPGRDLLTPCSACYHNLRRTQTALATDQNLHQMVNQALEVEQLTYHGVVEVRHLLDVLANDFGSEAVGRRLQKPLGGLRVAPYYGCQTVRPYSPFDNPHRPHSMQAILEALGVTVHHHLRESACCGASLLVTQPDVGLTMAAEVLAACHGADCIATVCPMCHMNLDAYQQKISHRLGRKIQIPVLHLPQLMGLAFGLRPETLGLHRHLSPVPLPAKIAENGTTKDAKRKK